MTAADLWERIQRRARVGVIATLESPVTVARYSTFTLLAAGSSTATFAVLFLAYGERIAAWSTFSLAAWFFVILAWLVIGNGEMDVPTWVRTIVVLSAANHAIVHVSLGGFANSGFYMGWGVAVVLTASMVLPTRDIVAASVLYAAGGAVAGVYESTLVAGRPAPDLTLTTVLFVWMLTGMFVMLLPVFVYFLSKLTEERRRSEELLLNVLPAEVAAELKLTGRTRARRFEAVSVLFADTVGFTSLAARLDPELVVSRLNEVFSHFDALAAEHGCEKIHTVGDAYMVACGIPVPRDDHAHVLAAMAIDMLAYRPDESLEFRIGMNSGPAVAGVIGTSKFQYDVWGDTVNTASRMESHGVPGRIQISAATRELIKDRYECTPRGPIDVKGKGVMSTWFLEGRLPATPPKSA